jgi:5-methylcytosine-specific restriction endonuclease McrA
MPIKTPLLIERSCEACSNAFTFNHNRRGPKQRFCSIECRPGPEIKRTRRKKSSICEGCGEAFNPSYAKPAPRFCTPKCSNGSRRIYPDRNTKRAAAASRWRARRRGVKSESFSKIAVYERDGWICGICAAPVDPELKHPDHYAASLDHIVPISKGGDHTMANCQCSHWICNSLKQAII